MKENQFDHLTMLFSTDWFLPYWASAGLAVTNKQKQDLQAAFQKAVVDMVGSDKQYYHVDFTAARIARTKSLFVRALQNALGRVEANNIDLVRTTETHGALFDLLSSLSDLLFAEHMDTSLPALAEDVRVQAGAIWCNIDVTGIDFVSLCLNSDTKWDTYTRSLTPDLPDMLANYAVERFSIHKFALYWDHVKSTIAGSHVAALTAWYHLAAKDLAGREIQLS